VFKLKIALKVFSNSSEVSLGLSEVHGRPYLMGSILSSLLNGSFFHVLIAFDRLEAVIGCFRKFSDLFVSPPHVKTSDFSFPVNVSISQLEKSMCYNLRCFVRVRLCDVCVCVCVCVRARARALGCLQSLAYTMFMGKSLLETTVSR
jgi:hypothetical protein